MKKILFLIGVFGASVTHAQDVAFARKVVDTLTSETFWGRGYTRQGMQKAAGYLSSQFQQFGLLPLNATSFMQPFSYPVNTFPGAMQVTINGKALLPGLDFIVGQQSSGYRGKARFQMKDSTHFIDADSRIMIELKDKLTWDVSPQADNYTLIEVDKKALTSWPSTGIINIENKEVNDFKTANIAGWIKGTEKPDSFIVFCAHYDHLGGMGNQTYFPGANDNASGISLLLGLARYYALHPQPYSVAFICFAGEEAGLLGSKYFTENPLIPLKAIRFLTNIDLTGTGDEGITVVNATEYPGEFKWLNQLNDEEKLLVKINARGKAANSDHYWFSEKGVPAFFIYTLGGIKAYHDVLDKSATLPLNEYEDLFKLLLQFNAKLMGR